MLEGNGEPARVQSAVSSPPSSFDTLGVHPFIGCSFEKRDDVPNAVPVETIRLRRVDSCVWCPPRHRRHGLDARTALQRASVTAEGLRFPPRWRALEVVCSEPDRFVFTLGRWTRFRTSECCSWLGRLRQGATPADGSGKSSPRRRGPQERATFGTRVVVTPFLDYLLGPAAGALWILSRQWAYCCS